MKHDTYNDFFLMDISIVAIEDVFAKKKVGL